jgi:hypothetical protein
LYLAVQVPDGSVLVFDGSRWGSALVAARAGVTLTPAAVTEFTEQLDPSVPAGTYTFYAVLAGIGTDPADMGNWLSNLARVSFTFSGRLAERLDLF